MKHLYIIAICCLFSGSVIGQSIEAVDWPGTVIVDMDVDETEAAVDVVNTGSSAVDIRVTSSVQSIVPQSQYRFCWGPTCYDWTSTDFTSPDNSALLVNIEPGATNNSFYTDYKHNGNMGTSVIDYCWWDHNNPSDEACYTLTWQAGPVSVDEIVLDAKIGEITPNPVTGTSSIAYNIAGSFERASIQIFNLVGELVMDSQLSHPLGIVFVNAEDFNAGIYLVRISADGHTYETKKMIVAQ